MPTHKMRIIPKPDQKKNPRTVMEMATGVKDPYFNGQWDTDYVCGQCRHVLAAKMMPNQIENVVLYCNQCGRYNEP